MDTVVSPRRPASPAAIVIAAILALFLCAAPQAHATLLIDDGQCGGSGGDARCTAGNASAIATAYQLKEIQPVAGDAGWANFQSAFNSWNNALAVGSRWTLTTGTLSAEAVLDVTLYRAYINEGTNCGVTCGGAEINITYNNGGSAPNPIANKTILNESAVWSQSISTNQKRNPSLPGNPYLDNAPGTPNASMGPPAYPFQYNGSYFYDMPSRNANASWLGDAWISTADDATRTLTVYDGVEWGFNVKAIPEPSTWAMMIIGALGLGFLGRRRQLAVTPQFG